MPGFTLPTIQIPGLRDMSTDDIRSALSDVRVPEVKASDFDPRKVELPRVDLSKVDVDLSGLSAAVSDAAAAVAERNPLRRKRRSRRRLVIGGLIAAVVGLVVVRNASWFRDRFDDIGRRIRERSAADHVDESLAPLGVDNGGPAGGIALPIEPDAYAHSLPSAELEQPTTSEELAEIMGERMPEAGLETERIEADRPG